MMARINDFVTIGADLCQSRRLLIKVYPTYSPYRKVARVIHYALGSLLTRSQGLREQVAEFVEKRSHYRGDSIFAVMLHKIQENGRFYLFEFDRGCELISFTKVSTESNSNSRIRREAEVLGGIAGRTNGFRVPLVTRFCDEGSRVELCLEAAGAGYEKQPESMGLPDSVFRGIASILSRPSESFRFQDVPSWLLQSAETTKSEKIRNVLDAIPPDREFETCPAHCDLAPQNILRRRRANDGEWDYFILDWEYFTDQAPLLTDRVSHWLGRRHRTLKRRYLRVDAKRILEELFVEFEGQGYTRSDVVIALLYLSHIRQDLAEKLCEVGGDRS